MSLARTRVSAAVGAIVVTMATSLIVAAPAHADGYDDWDCGVSGNYTGLWVSSGATSNEVSGDCLELGVRSHYRAYIGGPAYWEPWSYDFGLVHTSRANTFGSAHWTLRDDVVHYL